MSSQSRIITTLPKPSRCQGSRVSELFLHVWVNMVRVHVRVSMSWLVRLAPLQTRSGPVQFLADNFSQTISRRNKTSESDGFQNRAGSSAFFPVDSSLLRTYSLLRRRRASYPVPVRVKTPEAPGLWPPRTISIAGAAGFRLVAGDRA
jgi:hypothetical protein